MKKIFSIIIGLSIFSFNSVAHSEPAHFIAWGDEEGIVKRKGEDLIDKNEALPVLMRRLKEIDKTNKIDALLQTGDFVRFDPDEAYYKSFMQPFLDRFYP